MARRANTNSRPGKAHTQTKGVFGQPWTKGRPAPTVGPSWTTPQPGKDVIYNDGDSNRNLWVNGGLDG